MARRKPPARGDYKVGYGRPPENRQFPPGTSGNPNGRPKRTRSTASIFLQIVNQRVPIDLNGRTQRLAVIEVIFRRLATAAMKGDPAAIKLVTFLNDRYALPAETGPGAEELTPDDQKILEEYLTEHLGAPVKKVRKNGQQ